MPAKSIIRNEIKGCKAPKPCRDCGGNKTFYTGTLTQSYLGGNCSGKHFWGKPYLPTVNCKDCGCGYQYKGI
jgi:hypothetical protein|tara:strand:+ start:1248 stop:1463 length:216 start_codon:yes stop_codon:yes gene_type:complete